MLSGTIRRVVFSNKRPAVLMFLSRDGDTVVIRASVDGESLVIKDNHPFETSAPPESAISEVAPLDL